MPARPSQTVVFAGVLAGLGLSVALSSCSGSSPDNAASPLRIGAIPDQNPEKLNRLYGTLSDELSDQLDVEVSTYWNYAAAVSAFAAAVDLVWFGGLTGVQARLQTPGSQVLAQRDIDAEFTSVFIAHGASGLKPITSRISWCIRQTLRFRIRKLHLRSADAASPPAKRRYTRGFRRWSPGFSGSHDAIAVVQSGSYEAGALNSQVWETR